VHVCVSVVMDGWRSLSLRLFASYQEIMNQKLVVLAALVAVLALGVVMAQSPPKKPVWPKAFDCIFGMNYQRPPMKITNETSYFYYDFNVRSVLD